MYSESQTSPTPTPRDGRSVNQILAVVSGVDFSPGRAVQNLIANANADPNISTGNYVINLRVDDDLHGQWIAFGLAAVVS